MRLLVTRPEPDASETAARLRALGHAPLVDPLLAIAYADPPASIEKPAAILITSRNALRALLRWPAAPAWRAVPAFAVGPESATLARDSGFTNVRVASGDARALAQLVAREFDPAAGTILYPAARDRASRIDATLTAQGFRIERIEAYRAVPADRFSPAAGQALRDGAIDGVLLYSRRTAAAFRDCAAQAGLTDRLAQMAFFALSEEAAMPLRALAGQHPNLGNLSIRVASRPDGESLFALLPRA